MPTIRFQVEHECSFIGSGRPVLQPDRHPGSIGKRGSAVMGELTIMADGTVALSGPHRSDPVLSGTLGRHVFHLGVDLGQANDPSAFAVIEDKQLPLPEYDVAGRQLLGERQLAVVHLERLHGRDYTMIARFIAAMTERAPLRGRVSTAIDATGVGRALTDLIREHGVTFTPVTITGGGSQARGDNGYYNVSKLLLLSELAAHLESGRLRIANTPMGQELIAELNAFEVDYTASGTMKVDFRGKDYHGDLVVATALALWSAVGRPSGVIEVWRLEGWF